MERHDTRRRFEQWAKNPRCEANVISAVYGIDMARVATEIDHVRQSMGQSPFAMQRGLMFERLLFRRDAAVLLEALREAAVVPQAATGLRDLRLRMVGGKIPDLKEARQKTMDLFDRLRSAVADPRSSDIPWIVAGATVTIPGRMMLPEALLVIDVLVVDTRLTAGRHHWHLIVGEIKAYPDRGGYTDRDDLALARAQAGVYVHALRLVIAERGLADRIDVAHQGFLVLTRPGSNRPHIRAREDLRFQAERAARGFELLRAVAERFTYPIPADRELRAVAAAPVDYGQRCVTFCDRAPVCLRAAVERDDPAVLGDDLKQFLGSVSLGRTLEMLAGASPTSDAERDLAQRLEAFRHAGVVP